MSFPDRALRRERPASIRQNVALPRRQRYFASPVDWRDEVLYFLLVDRFSDAREGSRPLLDRADLASARRMPGGNAWRWDRWAESGASRWQGGTLRGTASKLPYLESLRLYCPGNQGVAIQATYSKLVQSVDYDPVLYIGKVSYIDYESQGFPLDNMFYPVMHKRSSFAHEQEVRLVKTLSQFWGLPERPSPPGISVDWAVTDTVEAIYVDPYAAEYYRDVVCSIVRRIAPELEQCVHWSQMRAAPVY